MGTLESMWTMNLVREVRAYLDGLHHDYLSVFLADWPLEINVSRELAPQALPVHDWMPQVVQAAHADTETLVKQLFLAHGHLCWGQTYSTKDFGARFLKRYGFLELIGLRGPVASDRLACGVLMLGPDLCYPSHRHEAEEFYVPLTGPSWWQRGADDNWVFRQSSEPVYHDAWMPHAMRTEAAPLLALYLWRGGHLAQKSEIG